MSHSTANDRSLRCVLCEQVFLPVLASNESSPRQAILLAFMRHIAHHMAESRGLLSPDVSPESVNQLIPGFPPLNDISWQDVDIQLLGDLYTDLIGDQRPSGSYYTPPTLAQVVGRQTLLPLLEDRNPQDSMRVLDLAMGSGHFLLAAGEIISEWIQTCHPDMAPAEARWAATDCLYGADSEPDAVELARLSLWLWAGLPGTTPAMLGKNLVCGDALLDDDLFHAIPTPFDAVIGNPPYASVFTRARSHCGSQRTEIQARYQTASGSFDLSVPFVELALSLCRMGGRCGLVLPNKLLAASYARSLRTWILKRATIEAIIDYTRQQLFDADVYPVVCIIRRQKPHPGDTVSVYLGGGVTPLTLLRQGSQVDLGESPGTVWSVVFDPAWDELRKCLEDTIPLGETATLTSGLTVGEAYDLRPAVRGASPGIRLEDAYRLVTSGLIRRYHTVWGKTPARYLKQTYRRPIIPADALPPRRREQAASTKIIVCGMSKYPTAVVDEGMMQASVATTVIMETRWPLGALCAVLNSRLMARLYRALFGGLALSGDYLRFGKRELSLLPLPDVPVDDPRITELDELAGRMARANESERHAIDAQIDTLIYELYHIDPAILDRGGDG